MNYVSTRNSSNSLKFKDVFIKGLAEDGGLFVPESLHKYSNKDLEEFKDLEYNELAKKIIFYHGNKDKRAAIGNKAKNIVLTNGGALDSLMKRLDLILKEETI